jgi:hypothetical protein
VEELLVEEHVLRHRGLVGDDKQRLELAPRAGEPDSKEQQQQERSHDEGEKKPSLPKRNSKLLLEKRAGCRGPVRSPQHHALPFPEPA